MAILNQLGVCLLNQDKYVESENIFREVLPRIEKLNGKDHTTVFTCLNNFSLALQGLNRHKEAELYLRRSLEGRLIVNGPDDTKTFTSMLTLASCLDDQNIKFEETEELYKKVLKGRELQLGINHPRYLTALKFIYLFLDKNKKYTATIYRDSDDADYAKNPQSYKIEKIEVSSNSKIKIHTVTAGGFAISILPN